MTHVIIAVTYWKPEHSVSLTQQPKGKDWIFKELTIKGQNVVAQNFENLKAARNRIGVMFLHLDWLESEDHENEREIFVTPKS